MEPSDEDLESDLTGRGELCDRHVGEGGLTRHHLLPRSRARKMKRRKKGRQDLWRRDPDQTMALCAPCHRNVHASLSNAELGQGYDTLEALTRQSTGSQSGSRTSRTVAPEPEALRVCGASGGGVPEPEG